MSNIKRTQFAQAAFDYSTYFASAFADTQVGGACTRKPYLVAPEGMSTAGGKMVRQHITLRPDVQGHPTLTVGAVDVSKGVATLRTFGYLRKAHMARFGNRPFDLDGTSYQAFFNHAQDFFARQGMRVDLEDETALPQAATPPAAKNNTKTIILAVIAVVVLGLLAAVAIGGFLYIRYYT
ncbi:MAG: hypothetical protein ACOC1F_02325 [Myxococcota bacterium]